MSSLLSHYMRLAWPWHGRRCVHSKVYVSTAGGGGSMSVNKFASVVRTYDTVLGYMHLAHIIAFMQNFPKFYGKQTFETGRLTLLSFFYLWNCQKKKKGRKKDGELKANQTKFERFRLAAFLPCEPGWSPFYEKAWTWSMCEYRHDSGQIYRWTRILCLLGNQ